VHPLSKVDRPSSNCSDIKSPVKEAAADDGGQTTPHEDGVTRDDVDCDVIDARRRHTSTSLDASLTTEVVDEDDVDDDNEDQDVDSKKRKKTRTVFSRHQVNISPHQFCVVVENIGLVAGPSRGEGGGKVFPGPASRDVAGAQKY